MWDDLSNVQVANRRCYYQQYLDDYIDENSPVPVIDAFTDLLDLAALASVCSPLSSVSQIIIRDRCFGSTFMDIGTTPNHQVAPQFRDNFFRHVPLASHL